ncbi:hypothetical protein GCM10010916_23220 [Paenibacillus abyssi]|uniref:Uncharacterized protein n=1 Tax=Paenibacillus abyssi TaxID=1340531 RepID=A0A917D0W3_9BACL|nr:hypothetical protein GCM10010916_23220 [Paenibacillus abyssi]
MNQLATVNRTVDFSESSILRASNMEQEMRDNKDKKSSAEMDYQEKQSSSDYR